MDYRDFLRSNDIEDRRNEQHQPGVFSPYGDLGGDNIFYRGDLTGLDLRQMPPVPWSPLGRSLGLGDLGVNRGDVINTAPVAPPDSSARPLTYSSMSEPIINAESGGNPNAKNPNSSASGLGQFIDSTWLATIKQAKPDFAQGKSDAELLALKSDPALSREMTEAYANQNQAILQKNGLPVTPGNTYLAHFAGPGGAVKVLQADPNAMAGDVLGAGVVKANPFLANMTARDLQAWADKKMGGSAPQPAQAAPAAPATGLLAQSPGGLAPAPQAGGLLQAPIFPQAAQAAPQAPQQAAQADPSYFAQIPAEQAMQAPPIQFAQRRPVNMTALRNALQQRAPFFAKG